MKINLTPEEVCVIEECLKETYINYTLEFLKKSTPDGSSKICDRISDLVDKFDKIRKKNKDG